jgi:hypothetical protein
VKQFPINGEESPHGVRGNAAENAFIHFSPLGSGISTGQIPCHACSMTYKIHEKDLARLGKVFDEVETL